MSASMPSTSLSASGSSTQSSSCNTGTSSSATNQGGKVKQTRRRQRLSCVECTKRRQKCDRQFPCGLCTTRGIPHMCRWEPIVIRPTPQRPPIIPASTENATIEALTSRIAALEQALLDTKNQIPAGEDERKDDAVPSTSHVSPVRSLIEHAPASTSSPEQPVHAVEAVAKSSQPPRETGPRALLDCNVQAAALALAQLSLAPRTEYVGGGSLLYALHKLGDPESFRLPYPITSLTSPINPAISWKGLGNGGGGGSAHTLMSPIQDLLMKLPPRSHTEALLCGFFIESNWHFCINERWFRSAMDKMWLHLDLRCTPACRVPGGGCPACREEVNPHWLCLLFSVLALSPASGQTAKDAAVYFMAATKARRLVDDILLACPEYSTSEGAVHGGVLSCLAAVCQGMYLTDRSRVSEAWKLIGSALRSAQALGLHRDPKWGKWEKMHSIEVELRVLTWWLLTIADQLISFILGRPAMATKGTSDVFALPTDTNEDGSPNESGLFLRSYISVSALIHEAIEKCLGIHSPPYATILEIDQRFQEWESQLPPKLRWRKSSRPSSPAEYQHISLHTTADYSEYPTCSERRLAYQRNTLAGWYLCALMNIHRPYLMHSPPIPPPPGATPAERERFTHNPSRERCIEIAIELTRQMTDFYEEALTWPNPGGLNICTVAYFIFDGAMALAGALSQVPPHPQSEECLALMDKAMRVLKGAADSFGDKCDGQADLARRGLTILTALRRAGGWDMAEEEKGELVLLQDMLKQQYQQQQRQSNQSFHAQPTAGPANVLAMQSPLSPDMYMTATSIACGPQLGMNYPTFGPEGGFAPASPFIPFPGAVPHQSPTPDNHRFGNPLTGRRAASSLSSLPLHPGSDMSFGDMPGPTASCSGMPVTSRVSQSMVMAFDILQGVQPNVQGTEFDLDWARVAGMESWYSNGAGSMDGNIIP